MKYLIECAKEALPIHHAFYAIAHFLGMDGLLYSCHESKSGTKLDEEPAIHHPVVTETTETNGNTSVNMETHSVGLEPNRSMRD
jgi:hypothetical protein